MTVWPEIVGATVPLADWMDDDWNGGAGWWLLMALGMLLFWGLVAAVVVWLIRDRGRQRPASDEPPLEILKRRLATGEISVEEYEQRRRLLAVEDTRHHD